MNTQILAAATALSDADLLSRLADLARRDRDTTVELVAHLAEMGVRKLYLAEGYGSLFHYCTSALRLSEHAAYARMEAARIARTFPVVLDRLNEGSLTLTTLRLVAPLLRAENHLEVLGQAAGRSKREVEVLVARLAPRPDVPASIRKLPASPPAPDMPQTPAPPSAAELPKASAPASGSSAQVSAVASPMEPLKITFSSALPAHRPVIAPLAPARYRVQFTMGEEAYGRLRLAQDLLRREIPDGDPAAIVDRALILLLADVARKKVAKTSKPRPGRSAPRSAEIAPGAIKHSRHIPAEIKRTVWLRDQGRCAFISRGGRRCAERAYLDFHHVEPYAIGGETTARNISLRCRSHNLYEAELAFGSDVIARKKGAANVPTRSGTSTKGNTREASSPSSSG